MSRTDRLVCRRSIVAASLGLLAGSAWADEEPTSGTIRIPFADGDFAGFQAQPPGTAAVPCVVVAGDETGTPDWIEEVCRRLARAGYLAVAPDLWSGVPERSDADIIHRLDAAFAWAGQNGGNPARIGLTGFGRGGRVTWLYAAQSPALKAAVAWGGAVGGATSAAQPKTPLDVAAQLKAPLLGLYGKADTSNPQSLLLRTESAGQGAGHTVELIVYVGAAADFAAEGRPTFDKAAATDGWNRMLAWFKRYGVA